MDKARRITDRKLADLERRVSEVYATDPSLLRIQKKYEWYMNTVAETTEDLYRTYKETSSRDERREAKKRYMAEVRRLTIENRQYKQIISDFTAIMSRVNQKALDLVNAEMPEIYRINYNQMAVDCRKVGIEVDG